MTGVIMKDQRECGVIYIYITACAVPSGKRETSSYITPGVLFKEADANNLAAFLHAGATVSRRWFKADDKSLA